ncbi:MAG: peptide ABC transporter substrate-binding protein [Parcubacteria group bacterium]|nr:peptide ABC transporter substrate-binding protein [Parcubacteria group bacterium]
MFYRKIAKIFSSLTGDERYVFAGALFLTLFSGVFLAADWWNKNIEKVPVDGGEYREGAVGQPLFVNPVLIAGNDVDRDIAELVFDDLSKLAQSYKTDNDGRTWTVFLKDGIRWHDGERLTSDDVVFTLDLIQDPETRSPLFQVWQGIVAERVSELEIKFILRAPYVFFADNLKDLKIIPRHLFKDVPAANIKLSAYNLEPVGSGPFKFLSYDKRRSGFITDYNLIKNGEYYGQKPRLDNFSFKFYPNETELIQAFNAKQVDGAGGINPKNINRLVFDKQVTALRLPRYHAIFFNPSVQPALKDKNVRLALTQATDKNRLIDEVFDGQAAVVNGPLLPGLEGYNPTPLPNAEYSPENAEKTLLANGWKNGEDGVKIKKTGDRELRLEFNLVVPRVDFLIAAADSLKEQWGKIGVKVNPVVMSADEIGKNILKTRNYEMILFGNILRDNPDLFSFWHSSEKFYPGSNLALYDNKTADRLIEAVRQNPDSDIRQKNLAALQNIIVGDIPVIFLFSPNYIYASQKDAEDFNVRLIATPAERFSEIEKWFVKTSIKFKK